MRASTALLTCAAMLAFAGNSLLCRAALQGSLIDPASFSWVRIASGAALLMIIHRLRSGGFRVRGNGWSAFALVVYAAAFSMAYVQLTAATGALLLFGAVQFTMIAVAIARGARPLWRQWLGLAIAAAGLVGLTLPGLAAPSVYSAGLMIAAGMAWGVYSLRARGIEDPVGETAGNFLRAAPMALLLAIAMRQPVHASPTGIAYALASGALASGVGYAIWYAVLPALGTMRAAVVQLSVPAIATVGGAVLLSEPLRWQVVFAAIAILGGVGLGTAMPVRAATGRVANPTS